MTTENQRHDIRMSALVALAAIAIAMAAVLVWVPWRGQTGGPGSGESAQQIRLGQDIYVANCASCHGSEMEGHENWRRRNPDGRLPAPPHDETGHTWHHADQILFEIIKHGLAPPLAPEGYESDMPAYADILSDREIEAVLAFIRSTWPPDISDRQSLLSEPGTP